MEELLTGSAVRFPVTGLSAAGLKSLESFGPTDVEGDQITFTKLAADRVPELVSEMIKLGGRVYEVVPRHQTLEDRFLQLLHED